MKSAVTIFLSLTLAIAPIAAQAQVAVAPNPNHDELLFSSNPKAAANKRLVYDFWREVFEGGHLNLAEKYLTEGYIQHNPNVPTGRAGFVDFFKQFSQPKSIEVKVKAPLVSIVAEGDMVVLAFVSQAKDPKDTSKTYTTTWFDMFRIENGKIAEHWDPTIKR
ncbi:nuclear transport factor 2 family protein [Undibacterium sp. Di24W]|uniref:nuclear transport factor 2 family protein n=1 Tax=Undibacterium sp. Di24W TaxID=3413033 RepID=UPI003BF29B24